jgi:hypothetical protein
LADDRKCDLKTDCHCVTRGVGGGYHFDPEKADACDHFHMPCPPIVTSKQDRLKTTRSAWDKRRDKMMREAERRFKKLDPKGETEEKLREVRQNPMKHLERKGLRAGVRRKAI